MGKKIYIGSDQIGSGDGGGGIDIQTLDASLKAYTYNKLQIDAKISNVNTGLQIHDGSINELIYDLDDVSTRLSQSSGADLTNYYTKTQTDASLENYAYSKSRIDASFAGLDASMNFIYDYAADVSARVGSGGGGGGSTPDLTNYATKSDISTFKPIQYVNLSTYEENVSDGTIDQDTMYVITDLASSDDLATLITVDDLSTYQDTIKNDLSTFIDGQLTTSKNSAISAIQSQQTTSVNAVSTKQSQAVSAVQSQQTTSVNAVNTAANNKIAEMPTFVVMTESDYNQITPNSSTIYFLT